MAREGSSSSEDCECGYERPSDELILKQHDQIREEQASKVNVIGDMEELPILTKEYTDKNYFNKIASIKNQYNTFRRVQSDGNCFYRAFIYGYLEQLISTRDEIECERMLACLLSKFDVLCAQGFDSLVFEETLDALMNYIKRIASFPSSSFSATPCSNDDALNADELQLAFRDSSTSFDLMVIMLLRLITSCEIQSKEDFFLPFILGMSNSLSCSSFCRSHVEPMNEESDHIHIVALSNSLGVPLRVVYLDAGDSIVGAAEHDFIPVNWDPESPPRVVLLYRPGHYDILYPSQALVLAE
uniref:ubiquitinyl hydrolase 1 n=1 Tax=Polytomella parva TaxID=51329 RepID=A0A7S0VJI6_9CHLO|mmetsp:Transcript_6968/g.13701  ORF Transcript_6968/g.13701 Transcript_6968/m.13701 type:complete len:300 (+) Transcript_6968:84-983(+)